MTPPNNQYVEEIAEESTLTAQPYDEAPDWIDRSLALLKARPWIGIASLIGVLLLLVIIVQNVNGTQPLGTDPTTKGRPLSNPDQHLHSMAIDPSHPGIIYLGSHYGLFTSTDNGKTWPQARGVLNTLMITSLSVSRLAPGTLGIVGVAPLGGNFTVYLTHDGGKTWDHTTAPKQIQSGEECYLVVAGATVRQWFTIYTASGLFVTNDNGQTWQRLRAPVSVQEGLHAFWQSTAHPQNLLLGSTIGLYHSSDGGQSWQAVSGISGGVHAITSSPASPNDVFVSADGGVYHSADGGATWHQMSGLVAQAPFSTLAISYQRDSVLYGLAGNEVWRSSDGGATWTQQRILQTSSPSALLVAPDNDQHIYAGFYAPAVAVESLDGGLTWHMVAS